MSDENHNLNRMKRSKTLATILLGGSTLIIMIFLPIIVGMFQSNPDLARTILIIGFIVLLPVQFIGFRYFFILRETLAKEIHLERMKQIEQVSNTSAVE